jgi:colanic acid biosynthesis glycosyl transferase WcaI
MKILLYGINFAPELTGIGKYSGEMAEFLVQQGHEVTVVTAPPYYPEWEIQKPYKKWLYQVETLFGAKVIRCPMYVPKHPSTLTRLLHLSDFALSSFFGLFSQIQKKPDVIIVVEPTLFCTPAALLFAKVTGAKAWLHIQDYEIDAMFGLGMAGHAGFARRFVFAVERWLMQRFDRVSTISDNMVNMARDKKGVATDKLVFFPNWANIDVITPMPDDGYYRQLWQIAPEDFVLLYSGNLGKKQGLELILDAARHFSAQMHVKFIIVGDGAHKEALQQQAAGLTNVLFKPLQPFERLSQLLACANVHLIIQKAGAADLVLPSKLTNILAAGGYSIITAETGTALGDFCENNPGIATRVEPEQLESFIAAIEQEMAAMPQRANVNLMARQYAESFIGKEAILHCFEQDLLALGK